MKILMVHSRYQQLGGEDVSTRNEAQLLRDGGHQVELVEFDNAEVDEIGPVRAGLRSVWSRPAMRKLDGILAQRGFDLLHVQNYLPLVSPAVLRLGRRHGVASVQALRNYRLMCANAKLFRQDAACTLCIGQFAPVSGVIRRCYRDSLPASAAIAAMIATHKLIGTWRRFTDAFIPVSEHVRQRYIDGGFDAKRLHAKPNVVAAGARRDSPPPQNRIVYAGRLTREKGVQTLIRAWALLPERTELVIAGDGPYEGELRSMAADDNSIRFPGRVDREAMLDLMASARAVVIPSLWDEPFPRTGVEAFSVGAPVIGAASGGIPELFDETPAGALFRPGDAAGLAAALAAFLQSQDHAMAMRKRAEARFLEQFSPAAVLRRTEAIYAAALKRAGTCDMATA